VAAGFFWEELWALRQFCAGGRLFGTAGAGIPWRGGNTELVRPCLRLRPRKKPGAGADGPRSGTEPVGRLPSGKEGRNPSDDVSGNQRAIIKERGRTVHSNEEANARRLRVRLGPIAVTQSQGRQRAVLIASVRMPKGSWVHGFPPLRELLNLIARLLGNDMS